jgi:hypothetical protein
MLPVRGLVSNNSSVVKEFRNLTRVNYKCYYSDDAIGFVAEKGEALTNAEPATDTPLIKEKEQPLFYILAA